MPDAGSEEDRGAGSAEVHPGQGLGTEIETDVSASC